MYLRVTFISKSGKQLHEDLNLSRMVKWNECDGDKAEQGYNTVLYSDNGRAFYSHLTTDELCIAAQGRVITEDDIKQHIADQENKSAQ